MSAWCGWFIDEKLFTELFTPKNSQNDRLYVPAAAKKQNVAAERLWDVSDLKQRLIEVWAQSKQEFVRPRWQYDMRPSARAEKYMCVIVIR